MKRNGVRPLKLGNAELGLALGLDCLRKPMTEIRDYLADLLPADDETNFLLAKGEGSCDEYSFPTKPSITTQTIKSAIRKLDSMSSWDHRMVGCGCDLGPD